MSPPRLEILCCHFDPAGFVRPKENLRTFLRTMRPYGQPITLVEAAFGETFEGPVDDPLVRSIRIKADPKRHVLWQKERLLNIGLAALPSDAEYVAWIDADLLFENPRWHLEAIEKLQSHPVVQLFEEGVRLQADGQVANVRRSMGAALADGERISSAVHQPGFAWAARREVLGDPHNGGGLYDAMIVGAADSLMAHAFADQPSPAIMKRCLTKGARRHFDRWVGETRNRIEAFYQATHDRQREQPEQPRPLPIGYVSGRVRHLFHGSISNRQYISRDRMLHEAKYDPQTDLLSDPGTELYVLHPKHEKLATMMQAMFLDRREDSGHAPGDATPASHSSPADHSPLPDDAISDGRPLDWAVGVTTAPRQRATLETTLRHLVDAGWDRAHLFAEPGTDIPRAFADWPLSRRPAVYGAWPNWYAGLTELYLTNPTADAYLMLQDDVTLAKGLRGYLEPRLWPEPTDPADTRLVGILSPYLAKRDADRAARRGHVGLYDYDPGRAALGAGAYVLPARVVRDLLADPMLISYRMGTRRAGLTGVDLVLGEWCRRRELRYVAHAPSLVQHVGETSTLWASKTLADHRRADDPIIDAADLA